MSTEAITRLAGAIRGSVVDATDATYDEARSVWNGTVDRRPELLVTCADSGDVEAALAYARARNLGVSVRSAGHHVAGSAVIDGGLVIDLGSMRDVTVDGATGRVRAAGGAQIGDVDRATQLHGLAVPLGLVSETGVTGLTLAGGYGWMRRKHGLSCDNVLAAEVVTADGQVLIVNADEHPELFWALRGGGWDLGVVTALDYQAHPLGPDVYFSFLTFGVEEARQVLGNLAEFARSAPLGFAPLAVFWTFPEADLFPAELWGQPFLAVVGPYVGDAAQGEQVCAALRNLGTVLTDLSGVVPWVEAQQFFDEDYPRGRRYYWKSSHLTGLDDAAVTVLIDAAAARPSSLTSLDIWINGGAIGDVPDGHTPIATRSAQYMVGIEANWDDPAQDRANIEWARATSAALAPFASAGAYLNFDDLSDPDAFRRAHGDNFERLASIKQAYDPEDLFRSRSGTVR